MSANPFPGHKFLIPLHTAVKTSLPECFTLNDTPDHLAQLAADDLQKYLLTQTDWNHNFGLVEDQEGMVVGKMFGVLVVQSSLGEIGYLAAFSGKLAGSNHHEKFVPPIFDGLDPGSFVNEGMLAVTQMSLEIKSLEEMKPADYDKRVRLIKSKRRSHSTVLQQQIFDQYYFLNQAGEKKSLTQIFKSALYQNPPSGAGECAAPKLLQYAFQHNLQPISLTEFWWGLSPKSEQWQHGQFYPCCREKCHPIMAHMLAGMRKIAREN